MFIGLNPSTADETENDPTVRRCMAFAKSFGCDSLVMTNLFAWRATDPREMKAAVDPVGLDNDEWLIRIAAISEVRVAAWGVHGSHLGRDKVIAARIPGLVCVGMTANRSPRHPLYVHGSTMPRPWP